MNTIALPSPRQHADTAAPWELYLPAQQAEEAECKEGKGQAAHAKPA